MKYVLINCDTALNDEVIKIDVIIIDGKQKFIVSEIIKPDCVLTIKDTLCVGLTPLELENSNSLKNSYIISILKELILEQDTYFIMKRQSTFFSFINFGENAIYMDHVLPSITKNSEANMDTIKYLYNLEPMIENEIIKAAIEDIPISSKKRNGIYALFEMKVALRFLMKSYNYTIDEIASSNFVND